MYVLSIPPSTVSGNYILQMHCNLFTKPVDVTSSQYIDIVSSAEKNKLYVIYLIIS